ncbi:hypothetical protein [Paraburkholderia fungorum]|uniref:hypothetical protein n=1 Tax=Paraburkholderia fungorum TaxID=134537 RepID=UPI0038BA6943
MKLIHDVDVACRRLGKVLHLDTVRRAFEVQSGAEADAQPEWVIVYRTARGFCCMYRDVAVEFEEMLDVQIWSEEMEVQPYFIGL